MDHGFIWERTLLKEPTMVPTMGWKIGWLAGINALKTWSKMEELSTVRIMFACKIAKCKHMPPIMGCTALLILPSSKIYY